MIVKMMVKTMTILMIIMTVIINHGHHDKMTMIVTRTMTPLLHDGDTDSGNMLVVIVSFLNLFSNCLQICSTTAVCMRKCLQ